MLLIYTHQVTNRVKYTLDVIFRSISGIHYQITTDTALFKKFDGAKASYSPKPIADEIHFQSGELLFETGVKTSTTNPEDIFALAFFMLSRYEEYRPFAADNYGRFSAKQSFAFKNDLLQKPVVNIWAKEIQKKIIARYPDFKFPEKKYHYTPTIDIDNAYAYLGKSLTRTLGGYARALSKFDTEDITKRTNVLSGKEKDLYDTYDFQSEIHKKYDLKPIYFFLLGNWAPNDKNLPHSSTLMQQLIKNIGGKAEIGIHPSYASNENPEKVKVEIKRLEKIISPPPVLTLSEPRPGHALSSGGQTAISRSRQHFLKLRFPDTYRNLIAAGITDDYTMGYADEVGFRAGICTPFKWYDLEKEEETDLTIHPFAVMDGTLNSYLKLTPEKAIEKVKNIIQEVKNVKGELITIWHNETLSDWREWRGWKQVYEKVIQAAV